MAKVNVNDIQIEYESYGKVGDPVALLIMGLAAQLAMWPKTFIDDLVEAGFRVVIFDNRDIGLSSKMDGARAPNPMLQIATRRIGIKLKAPYEISDMAADTIGLMDALDIEAAHIVGVSMGGMIGQHVAATVPHRVSSLTAIMTTTGNPKLPRPNKTVMNAMIRRGPPPTTREEIIHRSVSTFSIIGTPGEDHVTNGMRDRIAAAFDRNFSPAGMARQMAAIVATGDFRKVTRQIDAPTLVIHGSEDPLVSPECARDIVRNLKGARLEVIDGMGHDIPPTHLPRITELVLGHMKLA